jgi:hypothetical protein
MLHLQLEPLSKTPSTDSRSVRNPPVKLTLNQNPLLNSKTQRLLTYVFFNQKISKVGHTFKAQIPLEFSFTVPPTQTRSSTPLSEARSSSPTPTNGLSTSNSVLISRKRASRPFQIDAGGQTPSSSRKRFKIEQGRLLHQPEDHEPLFSITLPNDIDSPTSKSPILLTIHNSDATTEKWPTDTKDIKDSHGLTNFHKPVQSGDPKDRLWKTQIAQKVVKELEEMGELEQLGITGLEKGGKYLQGKFEGRINVLLQDGTVSKSTMNQVILVIHF